MQLVTVFPVISTLDASLISNSLGLVLIGGRSSFQSKNSSMKFQNFVIVSLQITINNYHFDVVLYIPKLLLIFIVSLVLCFFHINFNLVTGRLWSDF